jgi:hypothetical protein
MSMPEKTWRQRLGYGLLLLAVVATVGMLVLAIVLVHPALLIFVVGTLGPTAIPYLMRHPEKLFLTWASGTVTVAAIAPIITGGLFDPQRAVHLEPRSWAIGLGACALGYVIAILSPWLGERIALARQKISEIKFDRRRAELIGIWTEERLRQTPSARAVVGKDFVAEEEAPPPPLPTDEEAARPAPRGEA